MLGVPCAVVERALFDEMRLAGDLRRGVVSMDMAAAADLTSLHRMRGYVDLHAGWAGVPLVRAALELADEHSRSPAESRLRLTWTLDAGRDRPLANREVFDRHGRLLGIADLIDPEAGVVGEFDGAEHARSRRRSRDAERDSAFRDCGLEVFRVTGWDERIPQEVCRRIDAAYARAARSRIPRRWTLTPPPGRPSALTLDDVLDLRELERDVGPDER